MAKKIETNIEDYLGNNLQAKLRNEFGDRTIRDMLLPNFFETTLNPNKPFRPYQANCLRYFMTYWENEFNFKEAQPHLLFHMATGSGKTLIMAALIIYLFEHGYHNFLFYVHSDNVIEKTKDNLLNTLSDKYLFAKDMTLNGKKVTIRSVSNFQDSDPRCINLCITTVQGLHSDMNSPKEGALTYDDFANIDIVLISDEAHHINAATKKGKSDNQSKLKGDGFDAANDWETTIMRIFCSCPRNVLLEFTATADFYNPVIAQKYANKVIFDYPLKKFRQDKFSKDIDTIQADFDEMKRALQSVVLSQYRRKLAASNGLAIKPVILMKSKTIKDNEQFSKDFISTINSLTPYDLEAIKPKERNVVSEAFDYFDTKGVSLENLVLEIKEDFKEDNLLLVDGNNITPEKQQHLNSLEAKNNEYRVIFAVDMLNEGWDVLNLFDIVRLYSTRDSGSGRIGKTTTQEAQLIGRGARYMPFTAKGKEGLNDKRKFDDEPNNPLRMLETLHYHCKQDPKYISEIRAALVQSGIMPEKRKKREELLKESFKQTRLYKHGYVFANERSQIILNEEVTGFGKDILDYEFKVSLETGNTTTSKLFNPNAAVSIETPKYKCFKLHDFGNHVIRAALNRFEEYRFRALHKCFPKLDSIRTFIESDKFLANLNVSVTASEETLAALTQHQKLNVVIQVLQELEPKMAKGGIGYIGSKEFKPKDLKSVFSDHILSFDADSGSEDQEFGKSMSSESAHELRLDLGKVDWYGYTDNFGTSEEKHLILYIRSIYGKLREKYDEIYLLRNERDLKLYAFSNGAAYEPDFVLFLRRKNSDNKYDNIQIFIEPKGSHLRKQDAWKEEALQAIHSDNSLRFSTGTDGFEIWGMPFFGEDIKMKFDDALKEATAKTGK